MPSSLLRWLGRKNSMNTVRTPIRLRPAIEQLEDRVVPAGNLLANGDIESGYWTTDFGGGGSWASDQSHSPSHALKIGGTNAFHIGWSNGRIGVTGGASYTAAMWAKTEQLNGSATLNVIWYDRNGAWISWNPGIGGPAQGTSGWGQISATVTAPSTATGVKVQLRVFANSGTAWLDDISFAPAGGPVNQAPTVVTAARASPSPVTSTTTTLSVLGGDDGGEAALRYAWSILSKPAGAADPTFSANNSNAAKNTVASFSKAGSYTFRATITDAGGLGTTSDIGVSVNQTLTSIVVSPSTATVANGGTQQFFATARDQFAAALVTQPAIAWSLASGIGAISSSGLYTAPATGTGSATVRAASGALAGTAAVTVAAAPTANLVPNGNVESGIWSFVKWGQTSPSMTWATDASHSPSHSLKTSGKAQAGWRSSAITVTAGTTYTASMWAKTQSLAGGASLNVHWYNGSGSWIGWSSGIGGSVGGTTDWKQVSGSAKAPSGAAKAVVELRVFADGGTAWLDDIALTPPSSTPNQAPTVATAARATPSPVTGTTTSLSVLGADDGGEANLTYTWSSAGTPPASVSFSTNGSNAAKNTVATFSKAGSYTFQVAIRDTAGLTATSSVAVSVNQALTSIVVSPSSVTLVNGGTQQFVATARDQFGAALGTQPTIAWSLASGGVGTIGSNGLYTAPSTGSGTATVRASSGAVSGSAAVTVNSVTASQAVQNGRWELTLTSSKSYANPFKDVDITVEFTKAGSPTLTARGFWDGGNTFRARMAFTETGTWNYRTIATDTTNSGLHNRTGTINVVPYSGTNAFYQHGFLEVSADRRYLQHDDGTPFFWLADTLWGATVWLSEQGFREAIDFRRGQHFNVLQTNFARKAELDTNGQTPWSGDRWNVAFMQKLDRMFNYANDAGMYLFVNGLIDLKWDRGIADYRRLVEMIAIRYGAHHISWSSSMDDPASAEHDEINNIMDPVAGRALLTQHTAGNGATHPLFYYDRPYMDYVMVQTGTGITTDPIGDAAKKVIDAMATLYQHEPHKPIINAEAWYEGYAGGTARIASHLGYLTILSGGAGYTYGTNEWDARDADLPAWKAYQGAVYMQHMYDLFASIDGGRALTPRFDLIRNQPSAYANKFALAVSADNDTYVGFLPNGGSIQIDLTGVSGSVGVRWLNTRTGTYTNGSSTSAGGIRTFTSPLGSEQAVLILTLS